MANKLYIDIGDLVEWEGSFTGIQRVVFNVTKQITLKQNNVVVCAYDDDLNQYYLVDFSKIVEKFSKKSDSNKKSVNIEQENDSQSIIIKSFKKVKRFIYLLTPPIISRTVKKIKIKYLVKESYDANNDDIKKKHSSNDYIVLEPSSNLLVPGIHFDHDNKRAMYDSLLQKNIKISTIVYDLIPVLNDMYFNADFREVFRNYLNTLLKYSEIVFAISENTKKDLVKYANKYLNKDISNKVYVIRLGDAINFENGEITKELNIVPKEPYILAVSTIEVRKNYFLLYYAYKLLLSEGFKPPKLIIVGKPGWLASDVTHAIRNDSDTKDYIKVIHGISDKELDVLYKNCQFTVYASIYEGWGLPVAESMVYGKLCLASKSSSIVEVAGDLAEYFNPFNTAELANLIKNYSSNKDLLKTKSKMVKSYKKTTWEHTAEQIVDYLK